jgi:hypothetical protein
MKFFITFVNVSKGHSFQGGFFKPEIQPLTIDCLLA